MSDHPHGTIERLKVKDPPTSPVQLAPAPETATPEMTGVATVLRLVSGIGQDGAPALRRLATAQRHQALLALQPAVGNARVQHALLQRHPDDEVVPEASPPTKKGPKAARAKAKALVAAKGDAVAASQSVGALQKLAAVRDRVEMSLGKTREGRDVKAFFFKGAISDVALVIAGVHGSELSGVEVAEVFIRRLSDPLAPKTFFSVLIVPQLFPDNVEAKRAWEKSQVAAGKRLEQDAYRKARTADKDPGRYTAGGATELVDPNRQFPELGNAFDPQNPVDAKGRPIERENVMLLTLIDRFKPSRIAALHAIKMVEDAGIYADPHPSVSGGSAAQKDLAAQAHGIAELMAEAAKKKGAKVPGNYRDGKFTSLYPGQDPNLSADQIARENKAGRSLGQWGPSQGAVVMTIELNEQYASDSPVKHPGRAKEIEAHAEALHEIFVGPPLAAFAVEHMIDPAKERLRNLREWIVGEPDAPPAGGAQRSLAEPSLDPRSMMTTPAGTNTTGAMLSRQPAPIPTPAPAPAPVKHYSLEPGITLSSAIETKVGEIADAYYAARKKDIVVTSGTRTAASQAEAMYDKLEAGDDILKLYAAKKAAKEIKKAYDKGKAAKDARATIISAIQVVLETQIKAGTYISKHLKAGAVDVRSRDMTAADKKAFRKAAKAKATSIILETKPPHWHLQF